MAWRCTGTSNKDLINKMLDAKIVGDARVAEAMSKVDRANYVRHPYSAYEDSPQSIGFGATISAPHMHVYAASHLLSHLCPGARVLDIGSGSGYLTAVLYHLVSGDPERPGKVVAIEHVPELVEWSKENLRKDGLGEALDNGEVEVVVGDGRKGHPPGGPYQAIHVGAAAPTLPPALVEQLASPGRIFIPVGTHLQSILHVDKDSQGNVETKDIMGVRYVPLTDLEKQREL